MASAAKHDRQEVIHKATRLFWEKGFHATSMRNLQEVIDMRPGSIYASFGSKEGLFKEALQCYAIAGQQRLADCIDDSSSPLEALKSFITLTVMADRDALPSDMCLLMKTVAELTDDNAELLAEAKRLLGKIEDAFTELLLQAQRNGELDRSRDARRLARLMQMQLMGLRAYARTNDGCDRVSDLIDDAFACLH